MSDDQVFGAPPASILAVLAVLVDIVKRAARPEEALRAIRAQRAALAIDLDLVWEEDPFTGAFHYDALLNAPGVGTYALSLVPEKCTPWPLSGVMPGKQQDLLRVNAEIISFERAMERLPDLWESPALLRSLVNGALIAEETRRRAIEPDDASLQRALDAFRQERRLFTARATEAYLAQHGLTHEKLEDLVRGRASLLVLRDRIADADTVARIWERDGAAFDRADVATLRVREEARACAIMEALTRGDKTFYEASEETFLEGKRAASATGTFATRRRHELSPAHAEAIFSADPRSLVGPFTVADGFEIVRVLRITKASREDPTTIDRVKDMAFDEWLANARSRATIEWFWGTPAQTNAAR